MIYYKMKAQEWSQQFSHYKSMGIFEDAQGQLSSVAGLIWPNFEPIQAFIVDLVTCTNEEDPIKYEGARVVTTLSINFLRWSRRANSKVGDGILTKFNLIQAFIVVLLICKNKEDPFKIESTRVVTTFPPLLVYGDFSRCSRAANS